MTSTVEVIRTSDEDGPWAVVIREDGQIVNQASAKSQEGAEEIARVWRNQLRLPQPSASPSPPPDRSTRPPPGWRPGQRRGEEEEEETDGN